MLPAPHWLELTSVLVGVMIIGYSNAYGIEGNCNIEEDSSPLYFCLNTDDHTRWQMYFNNATYTGWVTMANCTPSACKNFDENRYQAIKRDNLASTLMIIRADRKNVGPILRCASNLGDQVGSCNLKLLYNSPPRDCKMEVDRANKRVTGSCVFKKFYNSDGQYGCFLHEERSNGWVVGQLEHSTFVDPVNGREYQNGTCYFAADLTRGYGLYIYRVLLRDMVKDVYPPAYTLDFAPNQTTTQTPDPTRVTELGTTPVHPIGETTTVIPSGPEKTSTQPASVGSTDPGNNTPDSGHKFTVLYALVGVDTVLIILTVIFVILCKARKVQLGKGAATPLNSITTSEDVQAGRPPQGREDSQYSDTLYTTIQDDAPSSSTARPDDDGYMNPVSGPSNDVSDDAPSSSTARPDDDGYLIPDYGPSNNVSDGQDGAPSRSSTARPINGDHRYLALVNEASIGDSVSPSGYTIPSRVR